MTKKLRAVAYLRVSTDRQAESGLGLDVQRECIRDWARRENARIVAWETDEGVSGAKDVGERPGLSAALAMISDGRADALAMAKLDRLARTLDVQEAVLAQVWRAGAKAFTCDGGEVLRDDPEDPMRKAMRQMMGVFSELERGMIAARMRAGRRRKAEEGGFAYGSPPFGTRAAEIKRDDGKRVRELVPHEKEAATIRKAVEMREQGMSLRAIAEILNSEGLKSKRDKDWHPTTLARVLQRASEEHPPQAPE